MRCAPDSPIKSFNDLLAQAKADPGKLTYTINALGSIYHVLTKWIELEAGVDDDADPLSRHAAGAAATCSAGRVDVMVDAGDLDVPAHPERAVARCSRCRRRSAIR